MCKKLYNFLSNKYDEKLHKTIKNIILKLESKMRMQDPTMRESYKYKILILIKLIQVNYIYFDVVITSIDLSVWFLSISLSFQANCSEESIDFLLVLQTKFYLFLFILGVECWHTVLYSDGGSREGDRH